MAGGCGGGSSLGGGSSSSSNAGTSSGRSGSYSPNYSADIIALRSWNKSVVTVSFIPPAADATGAVRDMSPIIAQAIASWNAKVGGAVSLQLANSATSDVVIDFVQSGTLPDGAIGRTDVTFRNSDQVLLSAAVHIDRSLSDDLATQVITHELGHGLGIEGHSKNGSDLMYAVAHLPTVITVDDQNTVLLDYNGGAATGSTTQPTASSNSRPPSRTRAAVPAKPASGVSTVSYD